MKAKQSEKDNNFVYRGGGEERRKKKGMFVIDVFFFFFFFFFFCKINRENRHGVPGKFSTLVSPNYRREINKPCCSKGS